MLKRGFLALILMLSLSFSIDLVYPPMSGVNSGATIDLGSIGPGQTVSLLINRTVTEGGIYGIGGLYTNAYVTGIPAGWDSSGSKLYGNPLQVTITAAPDALQGNYTTLVTIVDNNSAEGLQNITLTALVHITYDTLDFNVSPSYITTGPGQPGKFQITVINKGSAADTFQISAEGSKRYSFTKQIYVPAMSSRTINYEVVGYESQTITPTISVMSMSSSMISAQKNVTLFVRSDLFGDYKATNNGALIFPIFEEPIFSLAGLISNLFGK